MVQVSISLTGGGGHETREALVIDTIQPGGRAPLDRIRIVATAVEFIDAEGISLLSMRRLGSLMGVEAMSLYRYVDGREALLDAVVDQVMDELAADPEVRLTPDEGWVDFLVRLAHGVRRMALAHPRAFSLVVNRSTVAPYVLPPLRTLGWVDTFLEALAIEGFGPEESVAAYHQFCGWLLGQLLLEVGPPDPVVPLDSVALNDLTDYPHIRALHQELAAHAQRADAAFEGSLAQVVERIGRLRTG